MLLQYKTSSSGTYSDFPTPSTYGIEIEDLDANSYRSITTGNLHDNVISKSWSKIKLSYNFLTATQIKDIMTILNYNPIYIKAKDPALGTEWIEMEMRCSKKSCEMIEAQLGYKASFNLVQKKKVSGQ